MVELKIGSIIKKTKLVYYDSIKEMPIWRFNELQKMFFYTIGVGSTADDFNKHFSKLISYITNDKKDSAIQEMKNLYNGYFNAINSISPYSFCMVCMLHSVDGEVYNGTSLDDHNDMAQMLSKKGVTYDQVNSIVDSVKKNFIQNLDVIFLTDIANREMKMSLEKLNDNQ